MPFVRVGCPDLVFYLVNVNDSPAISMAEYPLTERKRLAMTGQRASFLNGCPK
jgi:hypothetical protein